MWIARITQNKHGMKSVHRRDVQNLILNMININDPAQMCTLQGWYLWYCVSKFLLPKRGIATLGMSAIACDRVSSVYTGKAMWLQVGLSWHWLWAWRNHDCFDANCALLRPKQSNEKSALSCYHTHGQKHFSCSSQMSIWCNLLGATEIQIQTTSKSITYLCDLKDDGL